VTVLARCLVSTARPPTRPAALRQRHRLQTTDDDRHQWPLLAWPTTLCVGGPQVSISQTNPRDARHVKANVDAQRKAASTQATMSKQHCRMLQVEPFFWQSRMLFRHCCWCGRGLINWWRLSVELRLRHLRWSTRRGEKAEFRTRFQKGSTLKKPEFPYNNGYNNTQRVTSVLKPARSIQLFRYNFDLWQKNRRTPGHCIYRARIASRDGNIYWMTPHAFISQCNYIV